MVQFLLQQDGGVTLILRKLELFYWFLQLKMLSFHGQIVGYTIHCWEQTCWRTNCLSLLSKMTLFNKPCTVFVCTFICMFAHHSCMTWSLHKLPDACIIMHSAVFTNASLQYSYNKNAHQCSTSCFNAPLPLPLSLPPSLLSVHKRCSNMCQAHKMCLHPACVQMHTSIIYNQHNTQHYMNGDMTYHNLRWWVGTTISSW